MYDEELIPVLQHGEYIEVHPTTFDEHEKLGWRKCDRREQPKEAEPIAQNDAATEVQKKSRKTADQTNDSTLAKEGS